MEVEVLSQQTNAPIVRMPGRRFPGMVIQGDTLHCMYRDLAEIATLAKRAGDTELIASVGLMVEDLHSRLELYERVLRENGYPLPYSGSL